MNGGMPTKGSARCTSDSQWVAIAEEVAAKRDQDFVASPLTTEATRLENQQGAAARAEFLRTVLRALVEKGRPRIETLNLPEPVKVCIEREYLRIERDLASAGDDHYDLGSHSVRCDFRIAGFGRIPVGINHIEIGGVPRRLLWSGGIGQAARAAGVFTRVGGWKPFYVAHFAHGIKPRAFLLVYTREAQEQWHRNVAACLRMNKHVRGLLATSWWYDPQLARIAPHLAFLREGSLAHGAVLLRAGSSEGSHTAALANSPDRKQKYERGEYTPVSYAVVWSRHALLSWAG
jgi:hypothetical protein